MALQHGRFHRRAHLTVRTKLIDPRKPSAIDEAVTENVSAQGARVLVKTPKEPGTLLSLDSPTHGFHASVRVVYCQRLGNDQFGVGLELQGSSVSWGRTVSGNQD